MRKYIYIILVILINFNVQANKNAGTNSLQFLKLMPGARMNSLSNALVAETGKIDQSFANPAGLKGLLGNNVSFNHSSYIMDMNFESIIWVYGIKNQRVGLDVLAIDYGEETGRDINENIIGNIDGNAYRVGLFYNRDFGNLSLGGKINFISEELVDFRETTVALDLGLIYQPRFFEDITLGISVKNLGSGIKYISESEDLPVAFSLGLKYAPYRFKEVKAYLELEKAVDSDMILKYGGEYTFANLVSLRMGGSTERDLMSPLQFGIGIHLKNFDIDYAFVPFEDVGDMHMLSVNIYFDKIKNQKKLIDDLAKNQKNKEVELKKIVIDVEKENLKLSPEQKEVKTGIDYLKEGNLYYRQSKFKEAKELYMKSLEDLKDNSVLYFNLASALYELKEYKQAIIYYSKVLLLNKNDIEAMNMIGICYFKLGKYNYSRQQFNEVIEIDSNNRIANHYLIQIDNINKQINR